MVQESAKSRVLVWRSFLEPVSSVVSIELSEVEDEE